MPLHCNRQASSRGVFWRVTLCIWLVLTLSESRNKVTTTRNVNMRQTLIVNNATSDANRRHNSTNSKTEKVFVNTEHRTPIWFMHSTNCYICERFLFRRITSAIAKTKTIIAIDLRVRTPVLKLTFRFRFDSYRSPSNSFG